VTRGIKLGEPAHFTELHTTYIQEFFDIAGLHSSDKKQQSRS